MYFKTIIVLLLFVCITRSASASDYGFSTWTANMVAQARFEAKEVYSSDSARLWADLYVRPLYEEVSPPYPVIGVIEPGPDNIMIRIWDGEDFDKIDKSFEQMTELLSSVRKLVGKDFTDAKQHTKQLNTYREKLRQLGRQKQSNKKELPESFKRY